MQPGSLITSDSQAWESRLTVNGVVWPHDSWSVDRDLNGDLPAQVAAVNGVTQATATIVWAPREDVTESGDNPWADPDLYPPSGSRVEIWVGDGVSEWRQFYGVIDQTTGSIGSGFQSSCIDDYDQLSKTFSHDALLRIMPPSVTGGSVRGTGLVASYYVDTALRVAGFYATPPDEFRPALHVPCQGSMWPYLGVRGTLTSGQGYDGSFLHARNFSAPWGWAVSNFRNVYAPRLRMTRSTPLQMTFLMAANHAGQFTFDVWYGSVRVRLAAWGSRNVDAYVGSTRVCGLKAAQLEDATIITLLVKNGQWTLRANNDAQATGTATIGSSAQMGDIEVAAHNDARVAGLQVSHPSVATHEFASLSFKPTARMRLTGSDGSTFMGLMEAGRPIQDETCIEVIKRVCDATLTAAWIDEDGVFQIAPSMVLNNQTPARTVTTVDDITELSWRDSLLGTRSRVTVKHNVPAISLRGTRSVTMYEGRSSSLDSGEEQVEFIGPGSDEDWINVNSYMNNLNPAWSPFNKGTETYGGVFYSVDGDEVINTDYQTVVSMERVNLTRWKITHEVGNLPFGVVANTATSPSASTLWPHRRNQPLPVVRAFGKVTWAEEETALVTAGGVGPDLTFDAGEWNSLLTTGVIDSMAAWLATQTSVPQPVITGLGVLPDPRIQLGDMVRIQSDLMGVELTGLIVSQSASFNAGRFELSLGVRIKEVNRQRLTYAGFNRAGASPATYAQWQNQGPVSQTYRQLNSSQEV